MTGICPHCGYNLTADAPIERGLWRIVPRDGAYYRGERVISRPMWASILMTLARMGGIIPTSTLLARVSESENDNTISSQICQMRRALAAQGVPCPIVSLPGRSGGGYRWAA